MPKISSEPPSEFDELDGLPLAAVGFDDDSVEWILVFADGRIPTLSAGDDPYYYISARLH
jgi:hypothetical protein